VQEINCAIDDGDRSVWRKGSNDHSLRPKAASHLAISAATLSDASSTTTTMTCSPSSAVSSSTGSATLCGAVMDCGIYQSGSLQTRPRTGWEIFAKTIWTACSISLPVSKERSRTRKVRSRYQLRRTLPPLATSFGCTATCVNSSTPMDCRDCPPHR